MNTDITPWSPSLPQKYDDDTFNKVASASSFLPRLQLMIGNSDKCKAGEFPVNHFALIPSKDQFIDLGKELDILLLAWRPKALEINKAEGSVLSVFDVEHQEFTRIREKSTIQNSGCMFGPEFLVWIPEKGYATFFLGSTSARLESHTIKAWLKTEKNPDVNGFCTIRPKFCENKKGSWYVPSGSECQVPPGYPDEAESNELTEKFLNPPQTDVEVAPESQETVTR